MDTIKLNQIEELLNTLITIIQQKLQTPNCQVKCNKDVPLIK